MLVTGGSGESTDVARRILVFGALIAAAGACGAGTAAEDVPPFPFAVTSFPATVDVASADRLAVVRAQTDRQETIDLLPATVRRCCGRWCSPNGEGPARRDLATTSSCRCWTAEHCCSKGSGPPMPRAAASVPTSCAWREHTSIWLGSDPRSRGASACAA